MRSTYSRRTLNKRKKLGGDKMKKIILCIVGLIAIGFIVFYGYLTIQANMAISNVKNSIYAGDITDIPMSSNNFMQTTRNEYFDNVWKNIKITNPPVLPLFNNATVRFTVTAPDMYSKAMSFLELDTNKITADNMNKSLLEYANNPDTPRIKSVVEVKMHKENGKWVLDIENFDFLNAITGNTAKAYQEMYKKAIDEIRENIRGEE